MESFTIGDIPLFRSTDKYVGANMYLCIRESEAVIVDPHEDPSAQALLHAHGVSQVKMLLTHEHHDHTLGISFFQERFATEIICQQTCAQEIASKHYLRPMIIRFILEEQDRQRGTHFLEEFERTAVLKNYHADRTFDGYGEFVWKGHRFQCYHTPGHSKGSCLIVMDSQLVFTGDSLLQVPVITRFPGSDHRQYVHETLPLMEKILKGHWTVLPGHGEPFKVADIMQENRIYVQFR